MSLFDRQGIPENLLRVNCEIEKGYWSSGENVNDSSDEDTDDISGSDADDSFQWDIATLRQYSFISASQDNGILTMHRLVQLAARSWLKSQGQLEQWNRQFVSILCRQFPTEVHDAYSQEGHWKKAEQLQVQVMETSKIKLGEDHPFTLTSMANLASTFWNQGRWEKAQQLKMQVMETRRIKLGEDHPDTLTSMVNLAFSWKSSGQHAAALDLLKVSLAKQKQVLGLDHPDVSSNLQTLLQWETEELGTDG
ncbi:hypothetical protein CBS147321_7489 [Aspergillus niger]|nr:hypothetical protein CBS147321_7489 [Aspergillus niger]